MEEDTQLRSRVNLLLPLEVAIQIEKESEKRGIHRAQFIKEAIHEKLRKHETKDLTGELQSLKEDSREIKQLIVALLEKLQQKSPKEDKSVG